MVSGMPPQFSVYPQVQTLTISRWCSKNTRTALKTRSATLVFGCTCCSPHHQCCDDGV